MRVLKRVVVPATLVALAASNTHALTFTVTSTIDSGAGSLRQAILAANASPGLDTIDFNIPGTGPHTIQPLSALPSITDPVVVDGYTQPGASPNTNPPELGSNAVLQIELDGSFAAAGPPPPSIHGLILGAGRSTVRGLVINRFITGDGIRISTPTASIGGPGGNVVEGNFIGTDISGSVALGNNRGVSVFNPDNVIGGTMPEERNILSGNAGQGATGIWVGGVFATGNLIAGNYIGTAADGTTPMGNSRDGIIFTRGGSSIGPTGNMVVGNTIAFNGRSGVSVNRLSARNAILSNSVLGNGTVQSPGLGIDLIEPTGVSPNDIGDGDTGGNDLQNFPVLLSATSGSASITGTLNSNANTTFQLQFFSNTACDPSGNGEGEAFLGSTSVTTDSSGDAGFLVNFSVAVSVGQFVAATTTDPDGNTSEFSECLAVEGTIVNVIDVKPGSDINPVNPKSNGVIPVAVLGSYTLDVTQIMPTSVGFGPNGSPPAHGGHVLDANGDGVSDILFHFRTRRTGISCGDTEVSLSGETYSGVTITGTDSIKTVPCK